MASFRKVGERWRAEVVKLGVRDSAYFDTKADAAAWATRREAEILNGKREASSVSTRKLLERFVREVSPTHKGTRWEAMRAAQMIRDVPWIDWPVSKVTALQIVEWRDSRLVTVKGATVRREMGFLSSVYRHAISEWRNVTENPCQGIKRPPVSAHRDRIITPDEQALLIERLSPRTAAIFQFALETGMRAGEICELTWDRVHPKHVTLLETKNGTRRDVPLTLRARELLAVERGVSPGPLVFGMSAAVLDAMFRKGRRKAGIDDVHFHDARHTAATRLAKKLSVLELCRMFGWRDTKHALIYYNESADSIADLLG